MSNEKHKPLTMDEEKELREWVSHFLVTKNAQHTSKRLHIPHEKQEPVCDKSSLHRTGKYADREWREVEPAMFPMGHKSVCQFCATHWREIKK